MNAIMENGNAIIQNWIKYTSVAKIQQISNNFNSCTLELFTIIVMLL